MLKQFFFQGGVLIPSGLIVPFYNDVGEVPSGWSLFNIPTGFDGDTLYIKGTDSSAGSTGGSNSVTLSNKTNTESDHFGSQISITRWAEYYAYPSTFRMDPEYSAGEHDHSATLIYEPRSHRIPLIKATEDHVNFPPKAAILSIIERLDLTDMTQSGTILRGCNTGEPAVEGAITEIETSTEGAHSHHGSQGDDAWHRNGSIYQYPQGGHDHDGTIDELSSDDIYRFYFGLYMDASTEFPADFNTVGMWESDTPPDGWKICDGTNGSIDLVDHFVAFDTSKIGTSDGDGTVTTGEITTPSGGLHSHAGAWERWTGAYHPHGSDFEHTHTIASETVNFEPVFYTLIFIQPA